jgi:hypothetical protein
MLVAGTYLIRAVGTKMIPLIMKLGDRYVPYALTAMQTFGSLLSFIESKFGAVSSVYMRKFSDGLRKPILNRLQNEQIDSKYRATSLSAIALFSNLLVAAAGPVVGWSMERYPTSIVLGVMGILGIVIVLPSAVLVSRKIKG